MTLPRLFLVRHGNTEWSEVKRHTGRTDIELTPTGRERAGALAPVLGKLSFSRVFTSPLRRASRTAALAGFPVAEPDPDLLEWDYGAYEGLTSAEIRQTAPSWSVFRDGSPRGESVAAIGERADRFVARVRAIDADCLAFSSAHIGRVIAARWLGLPPSAGTLLVCDPASIGVLGYDHDRSEPAIRLWNARDVP